MKFKKIERQSDSPNNNMKLFLSIKECIAYTGLSEYAIRNLVNKEAIPFLNAGRKVMINRAALDEYLKNMSENHMSL